MIKRNGGWSGHVFDGAKCVQDLDVPAGLRVGDGSLVAYVEEVATKMGLVPTEVDWSPHVFQLSSPTK
ncbi:MAG: hypothetical protein WA060_02480 [Minisyncoccia bacterium]